VLLTIHQRSFEVAPLNSQRVKDMFLVASSELFANVPFESLRRWQRRSPWPQNPEAFSFSSHQNSDKQGFRVCAERHCPQTLISSSACLIFRGKLSLRSALVISRARRRLLGTDAEFLENGIFGNFLRPVISDRSELGLSHRKRF
jgi:hypothetical protein